MPIWQGCMVAIVTPMHPNGTIDEQSLLRLLDWHLTAGTTGIVVAGTTGESATLTQAEKLRLWQLVVEHVQGKIPVIVGSGCNATAATIAETRLAEQVGVDASLLVTPYYNKPMQQGLLQHFQAIADAVNLPQILYNVPARTACELDVDTVAKLAQHENIIGIKDAGQVARVAQLHQVCPDDFLLLSGDDVTVLEFIQAGGNGIISVTANVAPALMAKLCRFALADDLAVALAINEKLQPLHEALFVESNPIPVKWVLQTMGLISAGIRLPLTPLDEYKQEFVAQAMQIAALSNPET